MGLIWTFAWSKFVWLGVGWGASLSWCWGDEIFEFVGGGVGLVERNFMVYYVDIGSREGMPC